MLQLVQLWTLELSDLEFKEATKACAEGAESCCGAKWGPVGSRKGVSKRFEAKISLFVG